MKGRHEVWLETYKGLCEDHSQEMCNTNTQTTQNHQHMINDTISSVFYKLNAVNIQFLFMHRQRQKP